MKDVSIHHIRLILDHLINEGCLDLETGEYPVVLLNERSREIIAGKTSLTMMLPNETKPCAAEPRQPKLPVQPQPPTQARRQESAAALGGSVQSIPGTGVDEALLEKLKDLRREIAKAAGVPAYIVFADASLRDMCRKRPVTGADFLEVSGVGEVKRERYGEAFTKLIRENI
jgi:ATP-dependent DNA helicase RecQ